MATKTYNRLKVDTEGFIEAWQRASSLAEVAEIAGTGTGSCAARASNIRKKGVKLKFFRRGPAGKGWDWAELAKKADAIAAETGDAANG